MAYAMVYHCDAAVRGWNQINALTSTPSALAMRLSVRTVVRSGLRSIREI